jgi:tetrahydromethanopterin S-methyltransferase subunit H
MNPAEIFALVQMVIQFLLQLFGRNPTAVKAYIDGSDTNPIFRPFVVRFRQAQLKVFTRGYAITNGLNADQVHASVLAELKRLNTSDILKVSEQIPAK